MIDVFRLTEAMKDLWGASGTEKEKMERLFSFKQDIQKVFICRKLRFANIKHHYLHSARVVENSCIKSGILGPSGAKLNSYV